MKFNEINSNIKVDRNLRFQTYCGFQLKSIGKTIKMHLLLKKKCIKIKRFNQQQVLFDDALGARESLFARCVYTNNLYIVIIRWLKAKG